MADNPPLTRRHIISQYRSSVKAGR